MKTLSSKTTTRTRPSKTQPEPRVRGRFRALLESAYLARAGAASMTLNDWREMEQEIKHKLEYECD
jgi:hypothetical protein